jgi:hypothetical protein
LLVALLEAIEGSGQALDAEGGVDLLHPCDGDLCVRGHVSIPIRTRPAPFLLIVSGQVATYAWRRIKGLPGDARAADGGQHASFR